MICSSVCLLRFIVWSFPQVQTLIRPGSIQGGNVTVIEQLPHMKEVDRCVDALTASGGESDEELMKKELIKCTLASLGVGVTVEALIKEIELDARLEARIDRLLKRLY